MLARVFTFGILGIEAYPVEIEVDVAKGLPAVTIVGLADTAIRESKERVKSAIKNSGFKWPAERITINLAPSDIKKEGAAFDLAIALGVLAASEQIDGQALKDYFILGELSLEGLVRPVRGLLSIGLAAAKGATHRIIAPAGSANEAGIVPGADVFPVKTLKQTIEALNSPDILKPLKLDFEEVLTVNSGYTLDFSEVKGQYQAKRALEVAVAGGHNIAMIGPPGAGKSMLAKRIPTIMPGLTTEEALEITKIHSAKGALDHKCGIQGRRPFRSPHHSISGVALVGGGSIPEPGEISLAHGGVLFLDELPEFRRDCLEALRQPLEDGSINISRAAGSLTFPASFMLVAAMNPCPCGYFTDSKRACRCNPKKIADYMGKISGPLLDRVDIHIEIPSLKYKELAGTEKSESSTEIRGRVNKARSVQRERFIAEGVFYNASMDTSLIRKNCILEKAAQELLRLAMTELGLSARAYDKILKVSRTIADLAESRLIRCEHISEAILYRSLDRAW